MAWGAGSLRWSLAVACIVHCFTLINWGEKSDEILNNETLNVTALPQVDSALVLCFLMDPNGG